MACERAFGAISDGSSELELNSRDTEGSNNSSPDLDSSLTRDTEVRAIEKGKLPAAYGNTASDMEKGLLLGHSELPESYSMRLEDYLPHNGSYEVGSGSGSSENSLDIPINPTKAKIMGKDSIPGFEWSSTDIEEAIADCDAAAKQMNTGSSSSSSIETRYMDWIAAGVALINRGAFNPAKLMNAGSSSSSSPQTQATDKSPAFLLKDEDGKICSVIPEGGDILQAAREMVWKGGAYCSSEAGGSQALPTQCFDVRQLANALVTELQNRHIIMDAREHQNTASVIQELENRLSGSPLAIGILGTVNSGIFTVLGKELEGQALMPKYCSNTILLLLAFSLPCLFCVGLFYNKLPAKFADLATYLALACNGAAFFMTVAFLMGYT